jgi:hypothetical protein
MKKLFFITNNYVFTISTMQEIQNSKQTMATRVVEDVV